MSGRGKLPAVEASSGDPGRARCSAGGAGQCRQQAGDDWRAGLPILSGKLVTLRELELRDAASLFAMLTTEEVSRFISPPPALVDGFERFITLSAQRRIQGSWACFGVTLRGFDTAIGLFQIRAIEPRCGTAEWGFAIGSPFWGTGIFKESAELVVDFVFDRMGAHRLEARAEVSNGRGKRALQKMGAVQEGVLRKSFLRDGRYRDQVLYAIVEDDWRASRGALETLAMASMSVSIH
jgi:[ribosomal protein S5]-alanine N-acetyltransferase